MAGYLAAQFPGDYYSGDEAKSLDFIGYFDNQRQKESARQNQEINRQMALEDLYAQQAERPLKEQRMSLENQGLEALLPQKRAQGQEAKRNWNVRQAIPLEAEQRAELAKLAKNTTEDELKAEEAAIKRFMSDPVNMSDPKNRARAEQMYGMLYEVRKMREGFQSKEDIAATAAAARAAAAKEATARQQAVIAARAAQQREAAARTPRGYQEAATRYRILAEEADDPEAQAKYLALSREFELAAQEQAKAGKAGGIDVGAVAELPTTSVSPQLGGGAAAPAPKAAPKVPTGRVIIYKDGKAVGTVPEAQREQALKEGYTLK